MRKIETPTLATTTTLDAHDLASAAGGMPFGFGHGSKDKHKDSSSKDSSKHRESQQTSTRGGSSSSYDARASRDPWMKSAKKQQGMTMDQFMGYRSPYYR
jgi:hypothetical protein